MILDSFVGQRAVFTGLYYVANIERNMGPLRERQFTIDLPNTQRRFYSDETRPEKYDRDAAGTHAI